MRDTNHRRGFRTAAVSLGAIAGLLSSCRNPVVRSAGAPDWQVAAQPRLSISDTVVPRGHEFNGIFSARRLADHSLLVANAGAAELVAFDSTGRFLRLVGRKGAGPGEYQGAIAVFPWAGDSLAIYDAAALRWTILDPGLAARRTIDATQVQLPHPTWLYRGAIVTDQSLDSLPSWVVGVLDALRQGDPQYSRLFRGRRDDLGALWIRDSLDADRWTVFAGSASPIASVGFPAGLIPLEIGEDFVLGVLRDSMDVESLRVYDLNRSSMPRPGGENAAAMLPDDSTLRASLPHLMMAQEMYYAGHGHYSAAADSLKLASPLSGKLFLLEGDKRHWVAVGVRTETGATCGVSVGWPAPLGWLDGVSFCGR